MQITIQELQNRWGVARSTVYKHIKAGRITRLDNGLIDVSEVIRVYGEPSANTPRDSKQSVIDTTETAILKEKIAFLEAQLVKAEEREERLRESEKWLKGQVETAQETIKLLEYKQPSQQQPSKRGLLGRVIGAIRA